MSGRTELYRAELRKRKDWNAYLKKNSGLPGHRANLELVAAVAEEGDADALWKLSASPDEFLALCGTAGLGRIALLEPDTVMSWLRERASDPRWRVREGVAIALQRIGRENMPALLLEMKEWMQGDAFVQRAVVAGLCEPPILKNNTDVVEVLEILDVITRSVAAAAAPRNAAPYLEKWLSTDDRDVQWIMRSNMAKSRMAPVLELMK